MSWVSREWHWSSVSGERKKAKKRIQILSFWPFCNASLPKDIRIGYLRVKVDPFIPNPLRCFKCQKYGRGAQRCSSAAVCPKCALEHEGLCTKPPSPPPPPLPPLHPKCVNCEGAHPSSSKECDVWKKEKDIQKVKTEKKCSYPDALKIVQETNSWLPGAKPLFASVAAKQMVSCAVQTDITWVKSDNPVRPKTPQPKGTQAGTQTSTPQQTPTKASQARPGRSSANKNPVEIVDGVANQKKQLRLLGPLLSLVEAKNRLSGFLPRNPTDWKKMEQDPVKVYNRFEHLLDADLADVEMEADHVPSKS